MLFIRRLYNLMCVMKNGLIRGVCLLMFLIAIQPVMLGDDMEVYKLKDGSEVSIESSGEGRYLVVSPVYVDSKNKTPIYYIITTDKLYKGVAGTDGKILIPPIYKYVYWDKKGFFCVKTFGDLAGVLDKKGNTVIKPGYDGITFMTYGKIPHFQTKRGGKTGVIECEYADGKFGKIREVIKPMRYVSLTSATGGGYYVRSSFSNGFQGYLNADCKEIIAPDRYTDVYLQRDGTFIVKIGNRSGVCDKSGKQVFFTNYNSLEMKEKDGERWYETRLGKSKGKIDLGGNVIEAPKPTSSKRRKNEKDFSYIELCDEKGNIGVTDTTGKVILAPQFDRIYYYNKELHAVRDGFEGIYTTEGKAVIPISRKYNFVTRHNLKGGGWYYTVHCGPYEGLCDSRGNDLVAPDKWSDVTDYGGRYKVREGVSAGIIDRSGNVIVPCAYQDVSRPKEGYYRVKLDGKEGYVDSLGNEVIPPVYSSVNLSKSTDKDSPYPYYFKVRNGDYTGLYTTGGDMIFPVSTFTTVFITKYYMGKDHEYAVYAKDGDRVCYFDFKGNILRDTEQEKQRREYEIKANELFQAKKWGESYKNYEKADRIHADYYSSFNMAVCRYNDGKYSQAIKHFKRALTFNPDPERREKILGLIADSRSTLDQIRSERANMIVSAIFTGVNMAANIYMMNKAQKTRRQTLRSGSAVSSYSGTGGGEPEDTYEPETAVSKKGGSKCGVCGGRGSTIEYTANYGIKKDFYCEECGKTVTNGHYHRTCTYCGGKGVR